ncbi:MAG: serine hydrolase, partial [Pseudomonadota bacterium]
MTNSYRRVLLILISTLFVVFEGYNEAGASVLPTIPSNEELTRQRTQNSLNLSAKLLCSGVFVSNRPAEKVIEEDLHWSGYSFFDWERTSVDINKQQKTVTLRLKEEAGDCIIRSEAATFDEGYGCTLLPYQATRLPIVRPKRVSKSTTRPLPINEANTSDAISSILNQAFEETPGKPRQRTRAILVLQDGQIIAEQYADGFSKETSFLGWSMGKSIAAILFGAFAEQNSLDIDDPVPLVEWQSTSDPRNSITPRHLLNMAGGLSFANPGSDDQLYYTDLHDHESVYFRSQNIERFVVDRPLSSVPGETFAYRNTNTLNLMAMIRRGIGGEAIISFADRAVFAKIGADSVVLETDPYGNPIITGNVYATARDWARLGDLVRRDGVIDGERLWPKGWRDNVMLK